MSPLRLLLLFPVRTPFFKGGEPYKSRISYRISPTRLREEPLNYCIDTRLQKLEHFISLSASFAEFSLLHNNPADLKFRRRGGSRSRTGKDCRLACYTRPSPEPGA